jgi:hypothetical protein
VLLFALLLTGCYGYHCWQPLLLHFLQFLIHIQDTTSVVYEDSSSHICGGSMRWIYWKSRDRPWSEVTLVTWPEVTSPEEVMTGSDRVYVRNRKLCNIRPSGDFWPEITSPCLLCLFVCLMVFNATFNNISDDKLYHIMLYTSSPTASTDVYCYHYGLKQRCEWVSEWVSACRLMSNEEIFRNIMARTSCIQGNEMKWNKMMISTFY